MVRYLIRTLGYYQEIRLPSNLKNNDISFVTGGIINMRPRNIWWWHTTNSSRLVGNNCLVVGGNCVVVGGSCPVVGGNFLVVGGKCSYVERDVS